MPEKKEKTVEDLVLEEGGKVSDDFLMRLMVGIIESDEHELHWALPVLRRDIGTNGGGTRTCYLIQSWGKLDKHFHDIFRDAIRKALRDDARPSGKT